MKITHPEFETETVHTVLRTTIAPDFIVRSSANFGASFYVPAVVGHDYDEKRDIVMNGVMFMPEGENGRWTSPIFIELPDGTKIQRMRRFMYNGAVQEVPVGDNWVLRDEQAVGKIRLNGSGRYREGTVVWHGENLRGEGCDATQRYIYAFYTAEQHAEAVVLFAEAEAEIEADEVEA